MSLRKDCGVVGTGGGARRDNEKCEKIGDEEEEGQEEGRCDWMDYDACAGECSEEGRGFDAKRVVHVRWRAK